MTETVTSNGRAVSIKRSFAVGVVFLFCSVSTHAALTLSIDNVNEEVHFSGQTSGTMYSIMYVGYAGVQWTDNSSGYQKYISNIENGLTLDADPAFDFNVSFAVTEDDFNGTTGLRFEISDNEVDFGYEGNYDLTVSGNETRVSYASLDQDFKDILEGYSTSDTIPLDDGTDFESIAIDAVPEPASAGLLAGAGLLLSLYRRLFSRV